MRTPRPTEEDRQEALRSVLSGLGRGADAFEVAESVAGLHPRYDTFPGEVLLGLAADALEVAGAGRENPVPYDGLRERFLPECRFKGRENRKFQFATLAAASLRGGLEPDLLDEVAWWQTDDFWRYALYAAVALIRACADRADTPVEAFTKLLADRHGISP